MKDSDDDDDGASTTVPGDIPEDTLDYQGHQADPSVAAPSTAPVPAHQVPAPPLASEAKATGVSVGTWKLETLGSLGSLGFNGIVGYHWIQFGLKNHNILGPTEQQVVHRMQLLDELARKQAKLLENLCEKNQLPSFSNFTILPFST